MNLLHANVVVQFLRKIHDRAKLADASKEFKKEGLKMFSIIKNKVCIQRQDL